LAVAFAFHAMRGMYLHAERLLAKAGRQSARGGGSPIRSKAEDERSEGLHKRSAEDCWETPCAAPGQSPQRGLVSLFVRVSAHDFQGRALRGRIQTPLGWVAEDSAKRLKPGKVLLPCKNWIFYPRTGCVFSFLQVSDWRQADGIEWNSQRTCFA
jgi:hypothetical protein